MRSLHAYYKNTRKAHKTLHIENKCFDTYCVSNTWGWQIIVHLRLKKRNRSIIQIFWAPCRYDWLPILASTTQNQLINIQWIHSSKMYHNLRFLCKFKWFLSSFPSIVYILFWDDQINITIDTYVSLGGYRSAMFKVSWVAF